MTPDIAGLPVFERPAGLRSLAARGVVGGFSGAALVACIPACDEEERIEACLDAADRELEPGDGLVLFANGCGDATAERAHQRLSRMQRPWLLLDGAWESGAGSAPKARRLAMEAAHALAPDAHLLSLDGDTLVRPGLRQAYAQWFEAGYDLVCGAIGFLPDEAALLPAADPDQQATVRDYRRLSAHLAALLDPDPDNPWPHHGNIGGANFAIRARAYAAVGGLPATPFGEDRALRRLCQISGHRIRFCDDAVVWTSCRLDGRARGGLADELLRERVEADPLVDELLEAPETLILRVRARREFLAARHERDRLAFLLALAIEEAEAAPLAARGGRDAWHRAEEISPRLARPRLRLSDLRRHLPELARRHHAIAEDPAGSPAPPATPDP